MYIPYMLYFFEQPMIKSQDINTERFFGRGMTVPMAVGVKEIDTSKKTNYLV